jgi:hypothetical protein
MWDIGEMIMTRINPSTWRKTCAVATLTTKIPIGVAKDQTQVSELVSRRHTAWAMGRCWASNTGRFIMFSVITNIYNNKTKGPNLMELFTATGKLKKFFFDN